MFLFFICHVYEVKCIEWLRPQSFWQFWQTKQKVCQWQHYALFQKCEIYTVAMLTLQPFKRVVCRFCVTDTSGDRLLKFRRSKKRFRVSANARISLEVRVNSCKQWREWPYTLCQWEPIPLPAWLLSSDVLWHNGPLFLHSHLEFYEF